MTVSVPCSSSSRAVHTESIASTRLVAETWAAHCQSGSFRRAVAAWPLRRLQPLLSCRTASSASAAPVSLASPSSRPGAPGPLCDLAQCAAFAGASHQELTDAVVELIDVSEWPTPAHGE